MATYLVTQATGGQSQWVITYLLKAGVKIHAMVRDTTKEPPSYLKHPNITLFQGEHAKYDDVLAAIQGCTGVFLNTFPIPGLEAQQARSTVSAAKEAGVQVLVQASTLGVDDPAMWKSDAVKAMHLDGYYSSKAEAEDVVKASGVSSWTILRPSIIHFDFFHPHNLQNHPRLHSRGELDHVLDAGRRIPFTDASDIGKYAAAALLEPEKFKGCEINMGNESLDYDEIAAIMNKVAGEDAKYKVVAVRHTGEAARAQVAEALGMAFHLLANAFEFSKYSDAAAGVQEKYGLPFTSLEGAMRRDREELLKTMAMVQK